MNNVKVLSKQDETHLIKSAADNDKYKLIYLLMLDAGLRITEAISLKLSDIDFPAKELKIRSLKKRSSKDAFRRIPISHRLYEAFAVYLERKHLIKDSYLFPSSSRKEGHIGRIGVYRKLKRDSSFTLHPHMLRHTFATKIVKENDLITTRDLLGHSSIKTTEIYTHTNYTERLEAINSIDKPTIFERLRRRYTKSKYIAINNDANIKDVDIRRPELMYIMKDCYDKKVNLFLQGDMGVGKSHLLRKFQNENNVLWLDDFKMVKITLGNLLKYLADNGKKKMIELASGSVLSDSYLNKKSSQRIIELILTVVDKKEFTIIIDDVTHVTKSGVQVLEKLKSKFHIIVAARRIKIDYGTFLSNFQKLDVRSFDRNKSIKLIYLLSQHLKERIEDYEAYKNYVYDQSNGNPLYINELIERLSKEQFITSSELKSINHIHSKKYIDFSLPIIICLSSLMVLRYVGGELGDDSGAFKLFGGVFLVFALFARSLFQISRKRYV